MVEDKAFGAALHLEVVASKFKSIDQSHRFMVHLLEDLFARQASLPFVPLAATERYVRESPRPPGLLFLYHFFRHNADDLQRAIQAIIGRPQQRLADEGAFVRVDQVRSLDRDAIMPMLTSIRGSGPPPGRNATILERLRPQRVFQRIPEETFDTPENRFLMFAARRMQRDLERLRRSSLFAQATKDERARRPFRISAGHLDLMTADPRLAFLPPMQSYPNQSRVLQRRDGYRELNQLWNLFQRASHPVFEHLQRAIDLRDVATMYEYWVWFELIDRIAERTGIKPVMTASHPESGSPAREQQARFGDLGTLTYNKTFSKAGVYSPVNLRPDYVWEREVEGRMVRIVIDAKFRLNTVGQLIQDADDDAGFPLTSKVKDDDLHKMHTYRDAIDGVRAAIVVYPGTDSGFWPVRGEQSGITITDIVEATPEGVGAIGMNPASINAAIEDITP